MQLSGVYGVPVGKMAAAFHCIDFVVLTLWR